LIASRIDRLAIYRNFSAARAAALAATAVKRVLGPFPLHAPNTRDFGTRISANA